MKKEFILKVMAIACACLASVIFVLDCITPMPGYHPDGILYAQWMVGLGFSLAILSMTALVWLRQKHSHFVLDDLAFCSSIVVGLAGALGLLVLLLGVCGVEIPEQMITAIKFPTLGMMALGFIGLALFFALQCVSAVSCKNWWAVVQTTCLSLTMVTIVVGLGRVSLFPTSLAAREVFYGMSLVCLALYAVSVFFERRKYDK